MPDDKVVFAIAISATQTGAGYVELTTGGKLPFVELRLWLAPPGSADATPHEWIRMSPEDATHLAARLMEAVRSIQARKTIVPPGKRKRH